MQNKSVEHILFIKVFACFLVEKKRLLQICRIESLSGKGYKKINRLINWFLAELQLHQ